MKGLLALTLLLLSAVVSPALAQDVDGQSSSVGEAHDAAKVQAVASSFGGLRLVLKVGQEVKVRDKGGLAIRGTVVSISGNELVIARPRFPIFRRYWQLAFSEDSVSRIDIMDSRWNGTVIGTLAGAGLLAALVRNCPSDCGFAIGLGTFLLVMPGAMAGNVVDGFINRKIYERQIQIPRITISPLLGRDRKGIVAQVSF